MAAGPCYVPDWEERQRDKLSILPDPSKLEGFDYELAELGWNVYKELRITDINGSPTAGEVTGQWMEDLVKYWIGAQGTDGARLVDEMLLLTAKKSTKTSSMALLTLTQFLICPKVSAKAIIVAPTKDVADIAFRLIRGAIETSPRWQHKYQIAHAQKTIRSDKKGDPGKHKELKVYGKDLKTLVGATATFVLLDELHLIGREKEAHALMDHMRGARHSQPEASMIMCSTHAHDVPFGVWQEELEYYRDVHCGNIDHARLMVRYEFPDSLLESGAYLDPDNWHMVNPRIDDPGVRDVLIRDSQAAERRGPVSLGHFRNQFLNTPAGLHRGDSSWPGVDYWPECFDPDIAGGGALSLDVLLSRSEAVTIGIDGGGLGDLMSLAVVGRERDTRRWLCWGHSWLHHKVLEQRPSLGARLQAFADAGELSLVDYGEAGPDGHRPLNLVEMGRLVSYINASGKLGPRDSVGIDNAVVTGMVDALMAPELYKPVRWPQIVGIPQGAALHANLTGFANRVVMHDFAHGNIALVNWAIGNVVMSYRGSAYVAEKMNLSPDSKIDPFMAMVFAVRLMTPAPGSYVPVEIVR